MSLYKLTVPAISLILLMAALIMLSSIKTNHAETKTAQTILPEDSSGKTPGPYDQLITEYNQFLFEQLDSLNNAGAATVVVKGDSILFIKAYGVKRAGTNDSVDLNTVFRLASVSKGFTGILATILNNEGCFSYEETVKSIIPDFKLKDSLNTDSLRVNHLLSHTSGLVPHAFDNLIEAGLPMSDIMTRLDEVDISAKPGEIYSYQNTLFSLIDTIITIKTGKKFDSLIDDKIFIPLGMVNSSVGFERISESANIAYPHHRYKGNYKPVEPDDKYYNVNPAAGINTSISDLGIWLKALLGNYPEIISPEVIDKACQPIIYTPLKRAYTRYWPKLDGRYYGLGWRIYELNGCKIIYHGGYVRGYRAEIAFCPEEEIGIAFLQNSPNRISAQSIPYFFEQYFEHKNQIAIRNQEVMNYDRFLSINGSWEIIASDKFLTESRIRNFEISQWW